MYISGPLDQTIINEANELIDLVRFVKLRQQCRSSLEPLICLYYINLCYNETDIIRPSEKQCKNVSEICGKELKTYNVDVTTYLPECVPESPLDDKVCIVMNAVNRQTVNCNKGFFSKVKNGATICTPECNVWLPYSRTKLLITNILIIFPAVVGTISGVAVLFFSWANSQKL